MRALVWLLCTLFLAVAGTAVAQEFPHGADCAPANVVVPYIHSKNPIRYAAKAHEEEGKRAISWFKLQNDFHDEFDYDLVVVVFHISGQVALLFGFAAAEGETDSLCFFAALPATAVRDLMRAIEGDRA